MTLVDLFVRKPLARLQILLLERRIHNTQPPNLACTWRIVALYVGFGLAVGSLKSQGTCSLLLMMQTLVVILEDGGALGLSRLVFGIGVCDIASEDFLPKGEAAGGTCCLCGISAHVPLIEICPYYIVSQALQVRLGLEVVRNERRCLEAEVGGT